MLQAANEKIRDITEELERSEIARKKSEDLVKKLSDDLEKSDSKCRDLDAELKRAQENIRDLSAELEKSENARKKSDEQVAFLPVTIRSTLCRRAGGCHREQHNRATYARRE